jgi:hypothetical protein
MIPPTAILALVLAVLLSLSQHAFLATAAGQRVIIVGAGMSGRHHAIYYPYQNLSLIIYVFLGVGHFFENIF